MGTLTSRSQYIPWIFVAGVTLVAAVNATMIWFAVGSFSGLYTAQPRDRGLHYNDVLAEQARRDALGWHVETLWQAEGQRLEVAVFDATGRPMTPGRLSVTLVRPVEKRDPVEVALHATDIGRFAGPIELPERGSWDLDIVVERDGARYALTRRMFLR